MAMIEGRVSAKIYQFPIRSRLAPRFQDGQRRPVELRSNPYPTVDCGGGWYHEAAMQDERHGKN